MREQLKQSIYAKIAAVGFILLILFGHFSLFVPDSWIIVAYGMQALLVLGLAAVLCGGFGLTIMFFAGL